MTRKAPNVLRAVLNVADELWNEKKDITLGALVLALKEKHQKAIEKDNADIVDVGIRVLVGHITNIRREINETSDLYEKEGLPGLTSVRVSHDGKIISKKIPTRYLTPRMLDDQPMRKTSGKNRTNKIYKFAEEMKNAGFADTPFGEYLNRPR